MCVSRFRMCVMRFRMCDEVQNVIGLIPHCYCRSSKNGKYFIILQDGPIPILISRALMLLSKGISHYGGVIAYMLLLK